MFADIDALPIGAELADELIPVEQLRARHAGLASAIRTLNRKLHKVLPPFPRPLERHWLNGALPRFAMQYGDAKADDTLDERIKSLEDQFEVRKPR